MNSCPTLQAEHFPLTGGKISLRYIQNYRELLVNEHFYITFRRKHKFLTLSLPNALDRFLVIDSN